VRHKRVGVVKYIRHRPNRLGYGLALDLGSDLGADG
jgi:hypothetical protein